MVETWPMDGSPTALNFDSEPFYDWEAHCALGNLMGTLPTRAAARGALPPSERARSPDVPHGRNTVRARSRAPANGQLVWGPARVASRLLPTNLPVPAAVAREPALLYAIANMRNRSIASDVCGAARSRSRRSGYSQPAPRPAEARALPLAAGPARRPTRSDRTPIRRSPSCALGPEDRMREGDLRSRRAWPFPGLNGNTLYNELLPIPTTYIMVAAASLSLDKLSGLASSTQMRVWMC